MGASTGYAGLAQRKQSFSVRRKPKIVDNKVEKKKGATELKEVELKKQLIEEWDV